jgi:hypothetical protein
MNDSRLPTILIGPVLSSTTSAWSYSSRFEMRVCRTELEGQQEVGVGREGGVRVTSLSSSMSLFLRKSLLS